MPDPLAWIDEQARKRIQLQRNRQLPDQDPRLVPFASNDYLGLAADPRVIRAANEATLRYGWGATGSPLVCGWKQPHRDLAEALASFEQTEAALLFPTGFAANLGAVVALVERGDAVYADRLDHACLIEGAKLSGATLRIYPHADADRLETILSRERSRFRRVLIATDGVFSMDGDLAPLQDLVPIAERFEAMLLVDEAHGTGVFGPDGRGAASECGVADRIAIRVGTLSKALGSIGGFVAGSRRLIDQLIHAAPTFIYSTALPPAAAAAAHEALRIAQQEPWRRERVRRVGRALASAMRTAGFQVGLPTGPIVPWIIGDSDRALAESARLRQEGFSVPAIRPPTVPSGTARLRLSMTAAHTDEEIMCLMRSLGLETNALA